MRVENANFTKYETGNGGRGNDGSYYVHIPTIENEKYSFPAPGRNRWVFKNDTVSFDWTLQENGHRWIDRNTIVVLDENGVVVRRGARPEHLEVKLMR